MSTMNYNARIRQLVNTGMSNETIQDKIQEEYERRVLLSTIQAIRGKDEGSTPMRVRMRMRGRPKKDVTKNDCYRLIIKLVDEGVDISKIYSSLMAIVGTSEDD